MAGRRRPKVFVVPAWRHALRAKFLDLAFWHNAEALKLLATDVRRGLITPRAWADSFDLGGTWVEEWAEDTLAYWQSQPEACPELPGSEQKGPPVEVKYPPPRDSKTAEDVFEFSVSAVPTSKMSLGLTLGGSFGRDEPEDDWERFRRRMHTLLDLALDGYLKKSEGSRAGREVIPPQDLDLKLETAALYFFRGMSPEELLLHLVIKVEARTTVYRWLAEILELLDLKLRPRGHPRRKSNVAVNAP